MRAAMSKRLIWACFVVTWLVSNACAEPKTYSPAPRLIGGEFLRDTIAGGVAATSAAFPIFGAQAVYIYLKSDTTTLKGSISVPSPMVDSLSDFDIEVTTDGSSWSPVLFSTTVGDSVGFLTAIHYPGNKSLLPAANGGRFVVWVRHLNLTSVTHGTSATAMRVIATPLARKRCATCTDDSPMRLEVGARAQYAGSPWQ